MRRTRQAVVAIQSQGGKRLAGRRRGLGLGTGDFKGAGKRGTSKLGEWTSERLGFEGTILTGGGPPHRQSRTDQAGLTGEGKMKVGG